MRKAACWNNIVGYLLANQRDGLFGATTVMTVRAQSVCGHLVGWRMAGSLQCPGLNPSHAKRRQHVSFRFDITSLCAPVEISLCVCTIKHHICIIPGCPASVKIKLSQEKLAIRPMDVVKLSCEMTDISLADVYHFWWLLEESNHLLYTFSVIKYVVTNSMFGHIAIHMILVNHSLCFNLFIESANG